jgi:hypothetical protein
MKGMDQLPAQTELLRLETEADALRWALQDRDVWRRAINQREWEIAVLRQMISEREKP